MSWIEVEETWMPNMVEGLSTSILSEHFTVTSFVGTPVRSTPSPA
jgi:hypothetical protein